MTVETATNPAQLNTSYPAETDTRKEGAQQMRLIKRAVQNSIKNLNGDNIATLASGTHDSILKVLYPLGICVVVNTTGATNPSATVGGTWVSKGTLTTSDSTSLTVFMRTA